MLAMALFLECYTKKNLSDADRTSIESKWLGRWKEKLDQPAGTPRQVMQMYCESTNITQNSHDLTMDWDCWLATEPTENKFSDLA
jgi:hypothetical protein